MPSDQSHDGMHLTSRESPKQPSSGSLDKAKKSQIEKEAPQPQVVVALGLFTTKREPSRPSE